MEKRGGFLGKSKLICLGDSNTYGFDPRSFFGGRYKEKERWVDLLAEKAGKMALNLGENGKVIPKETWDLDRLTRQLSVWDPEDLLVVMLGTNDLLQGASAEQTAARMEHLLQVLRQLQPAGRLLLLSPLPMALPEFSGTVEQLANLYEVLAALYDADFCRTGDCMPALSCDGVHLSVEGHRQLAEFLSSKILPGQINSSCKTKDHMVRCK